MSKDIFGGRVNKELVLFFGDRDFFEVERLDERVVRFGDFIDDGFNVFFVIFDFDRSFFINDYFFIFGVSLCLFFKSFLDGRDRDFDGNFIFIGILFEFRDLGRNDSIES